MRSRSGNDRKFASFSYLRLSWAVLLNWHMTRVPKNWFQQSTSVSVQETSLSSAREPSQTIGTGARSYESEKRFLESGSSSGSDSSNDSISSDSHDNVESGDSETLVKSSKEEATISEGQSARSTLAQRLAPFHLHNFCWPARIVGCPAQRQVGFRHYYSRGTTNNPSS